MHGEGILSHIFHCSPKGGKIKPHLLYRQTKVRKIYVLLTSNSTVNHVITLWLLGGCILAIKWLINTQPAAT